MNLPDATHCYVLLQGDGQHAGDSTSIQKQGLRELLYSNVHLGIQE